MSIPPLELELDVELVVPLVLDAVELDAVELELEGLPDDDELFEVEVVSLPPSPPPPPSPLLSPQA